METKLDLAGYLERALAEKNMTPADLARKSNIHKSVISKILNRDSLPNRIFPVTLIALADGLDLPSRILFEWAGWLNPESELSNEDEELLHLFSQLTSDDQEEIVKFVRLKLEMRQKHNPGAASLNISSSTVNPQ